ncbi:MAG: TIGR03617 family F420-dependent LLM class oxidoreductase [Pseudomonadales bacterium]
MKVDAAIAADMKSIGASAARLESLGYDGVRLPELNHDPFMPLAIAAEHTSCIELVTSVAVAFARNPMSMAIQTHDLNAFANGRFVLGLGSQVKPHIERRFSMPWHKAAKQMREYIGAMQAIFDCWYEGKRLDFVGEYYQHTLMPSTFAPDNIQGPRPRIALSATGPLMTKVAAELADGMIMHPFSSEKYMREVTVPAVQVGLALSGRTLENFELDYAPMTAIGVDEASLTKSIAVLKDRIAFYGCTVAYKPVLDIHGWGDMQDELIRLNRAHRTADMAALITDEMVHTIGIVGTPAEVVAGMKSRFAGIVTRTGFSGAGVADEELAQLLGALRE